MANIKKKPYNLLCRDKRGVMVYLNSSFNIRARSRWVLKATARPIYPLGMTRYPSYRRLGGAQGRSGRTQKNLRYGKILLNGIGKEVVSTVSGHIHRLVYPDRCGKFRYYEKKYISLPQVLNWVLSGQS